MPLIPGSRLGAYEIVGTVGSGGMGEVYRAHDPRLARDVALKVLPPGLQSDPESLERFTREDAEALRGVELRAEVALEEDEYWAHDLEGCAVVDGETAVGFVRRMTALPSCEVLEVDRCWLTTDLGPLYGEMSAAAVMVMLPNIVMTVALQRFLVRGLTLGAVKG